jgi:hypothetical protein
LQAQRRLGILGLIGFDEQIEGLLRILFGCKTRSNNGPQKRLRIAVVAE